jgi:putative phosphoesterase
MKIAVLADTHIPKRAKFLPPRALEILQQADKIIHAGDILTQEFLDHLSFIAPVFAVLGNNDLNLELPEKLEFELEHIKFALIHDSGSKLGRPARLRKLFPKADVVIFGHSHIPMNEQHGDLLLFNPGSATDRRRQPQCTMGLIELEKKSIDARIIPL